MFKKKNNFVMIFLALSFMVTTHSWAGEKQYCQYYPHWKNCESSMKLKKLERFIHRYQDHANKYAVAFDWDGTLYNEKIPVLEDQKTLYRSGQSVWHIWGAKQLLSNQSAADNLFPNFKQYQPDGVTINYQAWHDAIEDADNYFEGTYSELSENAEGVKKQGLPEGVYDKFSQIATIEAGMTFQDFQKGMNEYLAQYPASNYAFLKMLDIVDRLGSLGFRVWIITGSNPYFVANLMTDPHGVNAIPSLGYTMFPACQHFMEAASKNGNIKQLTPDNFFRNCPIAGNGAVWAGGNSPFARQYDARNFNTLPDGIKMAIDHYGKWFAAQHIVQLEGKPIILYAGNSDGDYDLMKRVLKNAFHAPRGTFGIFVQPDKNGGSDFKHLFWRACHFRQCIKIKHPS